MAKTKTSAKKKLIPAVAMLTTSAIMLSTATYAWFTMNKEVEVTGLQMAATTGDSLEITLGKVGETAPTKTISNDTRTTYGSVADLGWGRAEVIDNYYHLISKIKPASSDGGLTVYKIPEANVYAGGREVKSDAEVTATETNDLAGITLDTTYGAVNLTNWKDGQTEATGYKEGYYVDIPMWIRSNDMSKRQVNAYVKITDPNVENGSDLTNAVRVALIPVASTSSLSGSTAATALKYDEAATRNVDTKVATGSSVFALNSETYHSKVLNSVAAYSASAVTPSVTINQAADKFDTTDGFKATVGENSTAVNGVNVFTMPAATKDDYAAVLVVARVWIEGESKYCNDATANQDWNIDFHFALGDEVTDAPQD